MREEIEFMKRALLVGVDTGEEEECGTDLGERFLGVSYRAFLDTAMLSDVHRGAPNREEMHTAIENILFSGDESLFAARAAKALSETAHEIDAEGVESGAAAVLEKEKQSSKPSLPRLSRASVSIICSKRIST